MIPLIPILLVLLGTVIGAFGGYFFKLGADRLHFNIKSVVKNYNLILGAVFYVLSTVPFIMALKMADLSIVYPIVSITYVWIILVSVILLKEKMNKWKYLSIIFIILGVVIIGLS